MVGVAQLVRVPDCGSEGRGFESLLPPSTKRRNLVFARFLLFCILSIVTLPIHIGSIHPCCVKSKRSFIKSTKERPCSECDAVAFKRNVAKTVSVNCCACRI